VALMAGRVEEARSRLETALTLPPPAPRIARPLLAQIELVQNRKEAALTRASEALAQAPASPLALFSMGLVKLAAFDLPAATRYLQQAIDADPRFVDAYVYLAKIWLGSEHLSRAQKTIDQALQIAPRDPAVLSLSGFIRLAFRDYRGAFSLFSRAVKADPRFGEPHLGLAIYSFRYREFPQGLEEMLTATLLDPRVASYQTELGKALFQTRSFDRALEVYDYAKTLDPKDPTPYFYKGIALSNLNRAGEAVQEINKSIELNDNVAMFRSRSLLDNDLAVRNYSLAKSYQQLGLNEWAFSKAVTAVKHNPYDSSAHLFLRDVVVGARTGSESPFITGGLLLSAANTEGKLFSVLSRANQSTFSNITFDGTEALGLTTDYTQMFEMPYGRVAASGGVGTREGSKFIQDHQGLIYGGAPGVAGAVFGRYFDSRGTNFPTAPSTAPDSFGGSERQYQIQAFAKWEPTVKGTLTGFFDYQEPKSTDHGTFKVPPQPPFNLANFTFNDNALFRQKLCEISYYHRFTPESASLIHYSRLELPLHTVSRFTKNTNIDLGFGSFPFSEQGVLSQTFDRSRNNIQAQQYQRFSFLGQHSLIGGFDYLTGPGVSQRTNLTDIVTIDTSAAGFTLDPFITQLGADSRSPQWNYSFYLLDYWRPQKNLVLELGLMKDFNKTVIIPFQGNVYRSMWSPRLGANYQFGVNGTQHVLRAMAGRFLNTHLGTQPLLLPSEVAGFPWAIDSASGTEIRQAGGSWETQWNAKTFTVLRLAALRLAAPNFLTITDPFTGTTADRPIWQTWKRYQASLVLNRILFSSLGLSAGVMGKRVIPDLSFENADSPPTSQNLRGFSEFNAFLGLAYLHPQGWLARVKPLLVQQYGDITGHKADNPFVILNLTFGRDFPDKRGFALFEFQNLFNHRPFYSIEPFRDLEFSNQRRFLFRLGLYF
jgi:tetratricopeptide (TPR) repeat protein